ncbi:hypothetical protein LCGC14_2695450 [marine sediment metagenome]|uniref:Uncharacterized protein n=1 Tax=marine sediment metagenome TaxID=412755 RepID=A0A0F9A4U3_9ZZZZ
MRWIKRLRAYFECKQFAAKNYPVRYEVLGGKEWVLTRNLSTHQYGGVWIYARTAVEQWGKALVDYLKTEYTGGLENGHTNN